MVIMSLGKSTQPTDTCTQTQEHKGISEPCPKRQMHTVIIKTPDRTWITSMSTILHCGPVSNFCRRDHYLPVMDSVFSLKVLAFFRFNKNTRRFPSRYAADRIGKNGGISRTQKA